MSYTNNEAFDMLMVLGECFQSYRAAADLYANRYPERNHPKSRQAFQRLAERVRETGHVQPDHNKGTQLARPVREENAPAVLAAVQVNPQDSVRRLSTESGVSRMSVCRILKDNKLHPYRMSIHQQLSEDDLIHRQNFCLWAREKLREGQLFFQNVLWSDEATFRSNGEVNRHNMRYWAFENPHWMREVDNQRYWVLNTWCGIIGNQIIGPHFFEGNLNGEMYNEFLLEVLPNLLAEVPIEVRNNMWFQHDGAPAHFAVNVRQTLNQQYPEQWIGRGGPVNFPARSPDLTCLDYYLWGRLKDLVYKDRPTTREDMMHRIRNAVASISGEEVLRAVDSFRNRIELCMEQNGRQFEHL